MANRQLTRLARLEEAHRAEKYERWVVARAAEWGRPAAEVRQGLDRQVRRYHGLLLLHGDGPEGEAAVLQAMADDVGVTVAELRQKAEEIAVELGWT
jgi:hypothetical protein